ncbi:tRNA pseudouridine synthase A [Sorangium cellulosum]|uniref:tRNA pseudouridine synthase A n=1 Tax=Sorangium cellulosum TaxID=56 RepID=A0A2L0F9Y8_SORCE|nr:tRNA pseudouridine(38-40) synthase TruA [Sorangium cellulosum]AUX48327.1 tRNA pseudouridine synthase A [Sorangium cellulosum]
MARIAASSRGILLSVAYDGRPFAGYARQRDQRTVAGELLGALRAIDPAIREVRGASRTDAGVHARDQRVAFDTAAPLPPRGWVLATARHLPDEIVIRRASVVRVGFSPRFESLRKRYRYLILRDHVRDPFLIRRAWRVEGLTDDAIERARAEAASAKGTHDFAAFRTSVDERTSTQRTIYDVALSLDPADPRLVRFDIEGNAFLHNMVRILVGTLLDVARGHLTPGAIARAIASGDRRDAGITAPPDGLYLEQIHLRDDGKDPWPAGPSDGSPDDDAAQDVPELDAETGAPLLPEP